ncbi:TetR/AcrR family transcriptional regulator [Streptomyces sp. NBRC 109706]|uniref:TetR/AcrR family transcriptional regulator n=1 Tax=Streptomyces sp. NBRC 109706 TaxID=1550035 RepID=UPI000AC3683C|nr:TetR/AcrR family transcriptional regulator [Streptomyces sp. NBRC 109706]
MTDQPRGPDRPPARVRILASAEELMRTVGLARTTTRLIARHAGCSEAALYKHYAGKEEIFLLVLRERLPRLGPLLAELTDDPGEREPAAYLAEIVEVAVRFYESSIAIAASLFSEPELLRQHRDGLAALGDAGPGTPLRALAGYLAGERSRGRIAADADPEAAAALLLGACFQRAFLGRFWDREPEPPLAEFAERLAATLLNGVTRGDTR